MRPGGGGGVLEPFDQCPRGGILRKWPTCIVDPPSNSETVVETLWEITETLWRCLSDAKLDSKSDEALNASLLQFFCQR
jgi:hypothetical protein